MRKSTNDTRTINDISNNEKIINIVFDNKDRKVDKDYIVKNNNIVIDQSNLDKIKKNKQSKINLLKIDKNAKRRVFDAQILNIKKAKICEHILSKNRSKSCAFDKQIQQQSIKIQKLNCRNEKKVVLSSNARTCRYTLNAIKQNQR